MSSHSQIEELASAIGNNVGKLSNYLRTNNLPFPSFDSNGPVTLGVQSEDVEQARHATITQCMELLDLLQGPQMCVRPCVSAFLLYRNLPNLPELIQVLVQRHQPARYLQIRYRLQSPTGG